MDDLTLLDSLSERELDVLRLLAEDLSNREIAESLFISTETVKWYNKQIHSKLDVSSRKEAVSKAHSLGLLERTFWQCRQSCRSVPRTGCIPFA